jgi:UDP-glucose 4-epimerase
MIPSKTVALVTGGAGFIGSHIVDLLLSQGVEVRVLDNLTGGRLENLEHHKNNSALSFFNLDITTVAIDHSIFQGVSWIFHMAGIGDIVPSMEKPLDYFHTNTFGTARIAEAARKARVNKIVYAASSSCYGIASVPTDEQAPIDPQYPYALTKYIGEQTLLHWHQVYGLPVNSIRIFNAYGTRSRTSGAYGAVFGVFLRQKLADKPLTVVGDGMQSRDFIYVTDVAKAFVLAAQTNKVGEIYNIGFGNPRTINDLTQMLSANIVRIPERPGEPKCTWADITKISRDLGWEPEISLEVGVKMLLSQISYWNDAPLWDPKSIENVTKTWFDYLGSKITREETSTL